MILYSEAKVSPFGKVNAIDLKKILQSTVVFFAAPALVYLAQLQGTLADAHVLSLQSLVPSLVTIGAIEGWLVGIVVNFFLKFTDSPKK